LRYQAPVRRPWGQEQREESERSVKQENSEALQHRQKERDSSFFSLRKTGGKKLKGP